MICNLVAIGELAELKIDGKEDIDYLLAFPVTGP
jgi:hypothetical protein